MDEKNNKLKYDVDEIRIGTAVYMGARICTFNYRSNPVLYMFILPFKTNDNSVIVKIGYTSNIIDKLESLRNEFRCSQIFLIGIKLVRDKNDHTLFNKILKNKFKHQREQVMIDGISKNGTYWLSGSLMNEFDAIEYVNDDHLAVNRDYDLMETMARLRLQSASGNAREFILKELEHIAKQRQKMARYIDAQKCEKTKSIKKRKARPQALVL